MQRRDAQQVWYTWCNMLTLFLSAAILVGAHQAAAQTTSASMQIPPMQWLNLTALTSGAQPPPLKDSTIGYSELTRTLIIFGGVTSPDDSFATQQTYLLNLDTLVWSHPLPSSGLPPNLHTSPPARSQAQAGPDITANARRSWIIWSGKGADGLSLSDIWSYDFADQFWVQDNESSAGPTSRWGAAGGSDITQSIRVPNPANFQNDFYFFGGSNSSSVANMSDVWHLAINGVLAQNVQQVQATWSPIKWPQVLPRLVGEASAVLPGGTVAIYGGCKKPSSSTGIYNASCAEQSSFILNPHSLSTSEPPVCPSPRFGGSLTPNYNSALQSYGSQVFLIFGSFDESTWDDSGGSQKGEVAVLDTSSALWSRVIPSGDPSIDSANPGYPSWRTGPAVFSFPQALVGTNRSIYSDTVMFGGQHTGTGLLLNDLWILRSYNGSVSGSDQNWSGFGDGRLQNGIDADGQGVKMTFLITCARRSTPTTTRPSDQPTASVTAPSNQLGLKIDTTVVHKILSPISVALALASVSIGISASRVAAPGIRSALAVTASVVAVTAFITAITSAAIGSPSTTVQPVHDLHGQIGLTLTISLCIMLILRGVRSVRFQNKFSQRKSVAFVPNIFARARRQGESPLRHAEGTSKHLMPFRRCTHSLEPSFSDTSFSPAKTPQAATNQTTNRFEVMNRPKNIRALSSPPYLGNHGSRVEGYRRQHLPAPGDVNWLDRRRSLNAISEWDFTLGQFARHSHSQPTPSDHQIHPPSQSTHNPIRERLCDFFRHGLVIVLLLTTLLANSIFTIVTLRNTGKSTALIIFIIYSLAAMMVILWQEWNQFSLYRHHHLKNTTSSVSESHNPLDHSSSMSIEHTMGICDNVHDHQPSGSFPTPHISSIMLTAGQSTTPISHSLDEELIETHENETVKQLRMEQEMQRRDVSIVTVPRRPLRVANV